MDSWLGNKTHANLYIKYTSFVYCKLIVRVGFFKKRKKKETYIVQVNGDVFVVVLKKDTVIKTSAEL